MEVNLGNYIETIPESSEEYKDFLKYIKMVGGKNKNNTLKVNKVNYQDGVKVSNYKNKN